MSFNAIHENKIIAKLRKIYSTQVAIAPGIHLVLMLMMILTKILIF